MKRSHVEQVIKMPYLPELSLHPTNEEWKKDGKVIDGCHGRKDVIQDDRFWCFDLVSLESTSKELIRHNPSFVRPLSFGQVSVSRSATHHSTPVVQSVANTLRANCS